MPLDKSMPQKWKQLQKDRIQEAGSTAPLKKKQPVLVECDELVLKRQSLEQKDKIREAFIEVRKTTS